MNVWIQNFATEAFFVCLVLVIAFTLACNSTTFTVWDVSHLIAVVVLDKRRL